VGEAQDEVNSWVKTKWFRRTFQEAEFIVRYPAEVSGAEYRKLKDVDAGTRVHYLVIGRGCLNDSFLIHEFCHAVAGTRHSDVHGPVFAGILMFLYGKIRGPYLARKLKEAFETHVVAWDKFPKE
jgi:hypothetical protein